MLNIFEKVWCTETRTIYFLDICIINDIKDINKGKESKKLDSVIKELKYIDKKKYYISIILSLFEKSSDKNMKLDKQELRNKFNSDIVEVKNFFKQAKIIESEYLVDELIDELYSNSIELLGEQYINFLVKVNELGMYNSIPLSKRLKKVQEILDIANSLNISKQSIVVWVVIASLYGSNFAKKILKYKADVTKFNPSNALGDIMALQRIAIFSPKTQKINFEGKLITSDESLKALSNALTISKKYQTEDTDKHLTASFEIQPNIHKLLPDLFNSESKEVRIEYQEHYKQLNELLKSL